MKWFEPLIIIAVAAYFITLISVYFYKKKKGTLRCECGHYRSQCVGNCKACDTASKLVSEYHKKNLKRKNYIYVLSIENMQCEDCASSIKIALLNKFKDVKVYTSSSQIKVKSKTVIDMKSMIDIVSSLGYVVNGIKLK